MPHRKVCLVQETKINDHADQAAQPAQGSKLPKRQRPPIEAANLEAWDFAICCDFMLAYDCGGLRICKRMPDLFNCRLKMVEAFKMT